MNRLLFGAGLVGGLLCLLLFSGVAVQAATEDEDRTPPALVTFTFDPHWTDTAHAAQSITITAHITDDLSGFALLYAPMRAERAPSQQFSVLMTETHRISGTATDGVYRTTLLLPQYSAYGPWIAYPCVSDRLRNEQCGGLVALGNGPPPAYLPLVSRVLPPGEAYLDIVAIVEDYGVLDTLSLLLDLLEVNPDPGLDVKALLRQPGPFTFLAPMDVAFIRLPESDLERLVSNPALLASVLRRHVLRGRFVLADLEQGMRVPTLDGTFLPVTAANGNVYIGNAQITAAPISATNGVVHLVDTVLFPFLGQSKPQ